MQESFYRSLLTYSYNIVGSLEDARDLVQDTMEKYIGLDKSTIQNERSYLIKSVINLSINFKKRSEKFSKYGIWLPEPIATEETDAHLIKRQVANYSLLVLFEELNPKERAVFMLKESFNYKHDEIAKVLDISVENSRKLYSRSKKHLAQTEIKKDLPPKNCMAPYIDALMEGDTDKLETLFADDIALMADGGHTVKVVTRITEGKERTAELMQYVYAMFLNGKECVFNYINHQPALWFKNNGKVISCMVFQFDNEKKFKNIYSIVDPDKLNSLYLRNEGFNGNKIDKLLSSLNPN
ncbi:sigma-70 family RNA polymerase sigma factor [Flagellimonas olearia]|nr:sigma-70 family RNA polymerase sigma factor [Allomuricauda olearia]